MLRVNDPGGTTDKVWVAVKITNNSSEVITVRYDAGGIRQDNPAATFTPSFTLTGFANGFTGTLSSTSSAGHLPSSGSTTGTIAVGATDYYGVSINPEPGSPNIDANLTFTLPLWIKKASASTWDLFSISGTKVVTLGYTGALQPGWSPLQNTTSGRFPFKDFSYTGPPAPPIGTITATGATVGANGKAKVQIWLGLSAAHMYLAQEQYVSNGTPGLAVPNCVYTANPASSADGVHYRIALNGVTVKEGDIELAVDGTFAIVHNMAAQQMEGIADPIDGPEGVELPVNESDGLWGDDEEDPSHNRDDPPPVNDLGTDPKTDTADALSVKDYYRAMRAAMEDALKNTESGGQFDFAAWANEGEGTTSEEGKGLGTAVGSGIGSMTGLVDSYSMSGPGGGTAAITMHNGSGMVIGTITPSAWAPTIRAFILTILGIIFFLVELSIIRSGFAGK